MPKRKHCNNDCVYEDDKGRLVAFAPKRGRSTDRFSHYSRGWMISKLPVRIILIGQSDSGKTDIVEGILDGDIPSLSMQWDYTVAFSSTINRKLDTRDYIELGDVVETFPNLVKPDKVEHGVVVFDDPPPHKHDKFRATINHLFCNGRHKGYSVILCVQEVSFLAKERMGYVKSNAHLVITPTAETKSMLSGLRQHNIVDSNLMEQLSFNESPYMYNVIGKKRGRVYLLDRREGKESETLKSQLTKL